ncbi:MAG: helix-turn-helix domain-containing protein [Planctomycetota bacterium]|nr:helix-turn-helix domain-containing protein [Planctomycetota bacterium]
MPEKPKPSGPLPEPDPRSDLITYRIRLGLTLRELSNRTGLSPATLYRLERGLIKATPRSRIRLQDGLGLSTEQVDFLLRHCDAKGRSKSEGA